MKTNIARMKMFLTDYSSILFNSAAVNHLRIERAARLASGEYKMTIKFGSYSELKRYQKSLRVRTVSYSGAIALALMAFLAGIFI